MNCGCQFNLPSTHGYCQSAFVGTIVEGHFNDTPLSGLNWAALYKWPGEIKDGNGRRQIVIDERADEAQRIALETIISGEACKPLSNLFAVFASTCSEFCDTLFLPIDLEADMELRTARVEIPGVMRSSGRAMINEFNGQPFHIALARPSGSFEFTYAEIGLGTKCLRRSRPSMRHSQCDRKFNCGQQDRHQRTVRANNATSRLPGESAALKHQARHNRAA
jgi:hypothetical protein